MAKMHDAALVTTRGHSIASLVPAGRGHHWRSAMIHNKQAELGLILIHASGKHSGCGDTEWSLTIGAGRPEGQGVAARPPTLALRTRLIQPSALTTCTPSMRFGNSNAPVEHQ